MEATPTATEGIDQVIAVLIAIGIATAGPQADPFDQRSFPCQEDEVLGYAPEFGPDRVGCIHIDNL
ncbi:hypothetical protein PBI_ACHEBE_81 [Mycobacterium phage Achebe]|uniref:Uncharacterized protein n=3 Tax=Backyardiganvirus TaxID=2946815 RepID=A0A345L2Y7_9CAUD|nr:hypothetical protein WILE_81 [Mycobacterium phage Wile]YP_009635493.1 hypothetical protein FGG52_gp80 [Mycobacterium phage Backyardigan]YP_010062812.1 membrane protein [Mycobacterium phage Wizard007]AOT27588.1 hypothetical protein SEA_BADGER_81 [Mycobacterium phage Badger]APD17429.1 hypothetical protein PBI_ACHEBE_81 [Mycobacterium phage Achebe]AXH49639.1 hypothetical protein SEA_DRUANTIA_84 [Mycobacterium phage Druantia]AZS11694.1 hypothetical protein SEA_CICI_82 [Mycobacterium phage Cici